MSDAVSTRGVVIWTLVAVVVAGLIAVPSSRNAILGFFDLSTNTAESDVAYTCPMHPEIRLPQMGDCPICGMSLVEVEEGSGGNDGVVSVTPQQIQLTGVTTAPATTRTLSREIQAFGKLDYDETRLAAVSAWIGGRIDELFVDFTGVTVEKGHALVSLYSPDLISTSNEYLLALQNLDRVRQSSRADAVHNAEELVRATEQRLRRWGLTPEQIANIASTGTVEDHITIYAPQGGTVIERRVIEGMYVKEGDVLFKVADLSLVWLNAEVYEDDIPYLYQTREGDYYECPMHPENISQKPDACPVCGMDLVRTNDDVTVEISARAFPGQVFEGKAAFTDPVLNPTTRTVRVRVNVENPGQKLKPNMYARGRIRLPVGEVLAVPENAVLQSGARSFVLVEESAGQFRPQPVQLGRMWLDDPERARAEASKLVFKKEALRFHEVLSGVAEGEVVVTSGNFLLGSESQLQGALSKMMAETHGEDAQPAEDTREHQLVDEPSFKALLEAYYTIWSALSADKLDGVADAAARIARDAKNELIKKAAEPLTHANHKNDIDQTRKEFKALSSLLIDYVGAHTAELENVPNQAYCPMVDASWLQGAGELLNPYYGSAMLHCGRFIPWQEAAQ